MAGAINLADHILSKQLKSELIELNKELDNLVVKLSVVIDNSKQTKAQLSSVTKSFTDISNAAKTVSTNTDILNKTEIETQKIQQKTIDILAKTKAERSEEAKQLEKLQQVRSNQSKQIKEEIKLMDSEAGSIDRLTVENKKLIAERNKLGLSTGVNSKRIAEINTQLNKNTEIIRSNSSAAEKQRMNIGNYSSALSSLPGPLGRAASMVGQFGKALYALAINPVILAVVALTAACMGLYKAIASTDEGAVALKGKIEGLKAVMDALRQKTLEGIEYFKGLGERVKETTTNFIDSHPVLMKVAKGFALIFMPITQVAAALKLLKKAIPETSSEFKRIREAGDEYIKGLDDIEDSENNYLSNRADIADKISKLNFLSMDKSKSKKERAEALAESMKLSQEMKAIDKTFVDDRLDTEMKYLADKSVATKKVTAEEIRQFLMSSDEEQKNAKESLKFLRNNNEAKFNELEKLYEKSRGIETSYYDENRRNMSRLSGFREQLDKEDADRRKKVIEDKLKDIESGAEAEMNIMKDWYIKGVISEQQFAIEILKIQIDSSEKQLTVANLTAEQKLSIESKLMDARLNLKKADDLKIQTLFKGNADFEKSIIEENAKETIAVEEEITKSTSDEIEARAKAEEEAAEEKKKRQQALLDTSAMVFDTLDIMRQTELANIDAEEAYKLSLVGDNVEARERIEKEAAEERKKVQRKEAQAAKAEGLFKAAINTAIAISSAITVMPTPVGIALAIIVGIMGALQIAAIASKPIPKFAKGKENFEGGLAEVGEQGRELLINQGKIGITPGKPTLMNIPKGTDIIPNYLTELYLKGGISENKLDELISEERATRKAIVSRPVNETQLTDRGLKRFYRSENSRIEWIDTYIRK
jgi:hypothetical protein